MSGGCDVRGSGEVEVDVMCEEVAKWKWWVGEAAKRRWGYIRGGSQKSKNSGVLSTCKYADAIMLACTRRFFGEGSA
jgi:hypothetical protein